MIPHDTITSPANARVREAAHLRDADARRRRGLTLVDGRRELARAAGAGVVIEDVFVTAAAIDSLSREGWFEDLVARGTRVCVLADKPFARIAFGSRDEGCVGIARFAARPLDQLPCPTDGPLFLLEGVEKPGNLGAILRTADAAGARAVIVCDGRTDPANPAVIRASLGTVFSVPLATAGTAEAISWCHRHAWRVVAACPDGRRLWHEAALAGKTAILLGSEALGISPAWHEAGAVGRLPLETVRLPMHGAADSLNVSATAAVLAYEALRQRGHRT